MKKLGTKEMDEAKEMDEMDLDELLKELDSLDEAETINLTDFPDGATEHGNIAEEDDVTVSSDEEMKVSDEEEIDLETETTENKIKRSFFDRYVEKIKDFLDNAE